MINSGYILRNINKSFEVEDTKLEVLENLSLEIDSDEITVMLGPSGCGKTTLLRVIAGLEKIDSGVIEFKKKGNFQKPKVGFVFQESRLMYWLTVSENIGFYDKKGNVDIDKYLDIMNLQKFKNSYPDELSGGMAQRVSIARALSFEPDILLMDEPFSSLDYFLREDMQNEVVRIHKTTNKGIVFVTHDIDEALKIGKKLIVFNGKKIVEIIVDDSQERDLSSGYYLELKRLLLEILRSSRQTYME
ncbi:MAG: ABC transporter ATP-binding protein [Clostridioides sp.]|nr:ABC transporter ATP-binding protein [Clostridioides sp.]